MPTAIEQGYEAQGYQLPAGVTWAMVHEYRAKYEIGAIYVPVVCAADCTAWAVPYINGKPLKH